jgi:uncharacterized membrane protein HdeD (DUF308 family)
MSEEPIRLGRFWWISVVRGCISLLLGVSVLFAVSNRGRLANFVGVYWLLSGLLMIRWALAVRWVRGSRIGLAAGSVSVVAAALLLLRGPLQHVVSQDALIDVLGAAAIFMGALRLLGAFEIERRTGRRWTFGGLALGSVEVVIGVVLIFARRENARALTIALATWGLVGGGLLLIEGIRLRRLAHADVARRAAPETPASRA